MTIRKAEHYLKADITLLAAAFIWGFAFVAQRAGMQFIGPFLFNAIRFFLGTLIMLFLMKSSYPGFIRIPRVDLLQAGLAFVAGIILFLAASLQQLGLVYTTAGKAGFITGFYVVLVPFFGIWWSREKPGMYHFAGAFLALAGIYLLSLKNIHSVNRGDLLVFASAFFWAAHVIWLGNFSARVHIFTFAAIQYGICSILSMVFAVLMESISLNAVREALLPLLYGGVMSVGIAFTLQIQGQKTAHPAHAAIILSLEGVFAVLGGLLLLKETLTTRIIAGCFLILCGMVLAQVTRHRILARKPFFPD
ncbi:MAG: DMT family transporter [Candidatus Cloacimonetes bacterium]|nr:DMT family transporter [Candidatus Cloacimonadota bacterium]